MSEKTKVLGRKRHKLRTQLEEVTAELKASCLEDYADGQGESQTAIAQAAGVDRAKTLRPWLGLGRGKN